jgi:site-specific DNA recombinase
MTYRGPGEYTWRDLGEHPSLGGNEAVISGDLWERCRARGDAQAAMAPRLRTAVHDLSGLMVCGYEGCRGPMVSAYSGKHDKHSWVCYRARDHKAHLFNSVRNARAVDEVKAWLAKHAEGGQDVTERARCLRAASRAFSEAGRPPGSVEQGRYCGTSWSCLARMCLGRR